MESKFIALGVVVIVVAAAIGGGVYMMMNMNKGDNIELEKPTLLVYGNANGDYYLNTDDVTKLKELIESKPSDWQETNPFADTNCDGSLTNDDVTMLESILNADKDHQVKINVCSYAVQKAYISKVRYPVTKAACNTNQTTMATLKTLGIDSEIVSTSVAATSTNLDGSVKQEKYDKYIFGNYFDVMDQPHQIGAKSCDVNSSTLADIITSYGCTVYLYSASQAALSNYVTLSSQIDFVQVADGESEIKDYGSAILLVGFLFGTSDNNYVSKSVEAVDWFLDFEKDLKNGIKNVDKVSAVASSMTTYVAIKGSSNTSVIESAGLSCPVGNMLPIDASSTTKMYTDGTDTWLNAIPMDAFVILRGSTGGWSWFDGDYSTEHLPADFTTHIENYKTLDCYKKGNIIVVSTMMCGPQKSGAIAQYYYGDKLGENWYNDKMTDFYTKFWGFSAEDCAKFKYVLTQAEVLGTA